MGDAIPPQRCRCCVGKKRAARRRPAAHPAVSRGSPLFRCTLRCRWRRQAGVARGECGTAPGSQILGGSLLVSGTAPSGGVPPSGVPGVPFHLGPRPPRRDWLPRAPAAQWGQGRRRPRCWPRPSPRRCCCRCRRGTSRRPPRPPGPPAPPRSRRRLSLSNTLTLSCRVVRAAVR